MNNTTLYKKILFGLIALFGWVSCSSNSSKNTKMIEGKTNYKIIPKYVRKQNKSNPTPITWYPADPNDLNKIQNPNSFTLSLSTGAKIGFELRKDIEMVAESDGKIDGKSYKKNELVETKKDIVVSGSELSSNFDFDHSGTDAGLLPVGIATNSTPAPKFRVEESNDLFTFEFGRMGGGLPVNKIKVTVKDKSNGKEVASVSYTING